MSKQLVEPAYHKHRRVLSGEVVQPRGDSAKILLNLVLAAVLATTTNDNIGLIGKRITGIIAMENGRIAVLGKSSGKGKCIAGVPINIHILGV